MGEREMVEFEPNVLPSVPDGAVALRDLWRHSGEEVRRRLLSNGGLLSRLYMRFHEQESRRFGFAAPQGDEFFVVAAAE